MTSSITSNPTIIQTQQNNSSALNGRPIHIPTLQDEVVDFSELNLEGNKKMDENAMPRFDDIQEEDIIRFDQPMNLEDNEEKKSEDNFDHKNVQSPNKNLQTIAYDEDNSKEKVNQHSINNKLKSITSNPINRQQAHSISVVENDFKAEGSRKVDIGLSGLKKNMSSINNAEVLNIRSPVKLNKTFTAMSLQNSFIRESNGKGRYDMESESE